ncbi:MAG: type secretion system protein [Burkholderiales bacterium]|nr:type secretion system protein [Burkholderiales bacterium]
MSMPLPRKAGFTLVELMVVLAVIALLISIVAPHYVGRIARAEEAVLRENLVLMRDALDRHYTTWMVIAPDDLKKGAVYDVRSGAKGNGASGKPYAQW